MEKNAIPIVYTGIQKQSSKFGFFLAALTGRGGVGVAISIVCIPFVSPAFRKICLPYVPATTNQIRNILKALKGKSGLLIDIGSGDGRIVFAAAKAGFKAHGVELNPWLIGFSQISALIKGVSSKTLFFRQDLWKFNLQKYNNVIIFGVEQMMEELEEKFKTELKSNCTIIVCRFPLINCKPKLTIGNGIDTVWVYETPLQDNLTYKSS